MEDLNKIKDDLINALVILSKSTLSDKDKIKECDKIIFDIINYIDPIIDSKNKEELYINTAYDILMKKHHTAGVIQEEYRDGDVLFEYYIASHDYSAGRSSDVISENEIKKELLLKNKTDNSR